MTLKKKGGPLPTATPKQLKDETPDTSLISAAPQQILTRFQEDCERLERDLERLGYLPAIFTGRSGCLALDVLDRIAEFRNRYRQKVKDFLYEHPGAIPHWHVDVQSRRSLSRDTEAIYEALASVFPFLTPAEFLKYCSSSISALNRFMECGGEGIDLVVKNALGELISQETVVSLRRDKEEGRAE